MIKMIILLFMVFSLNLRSQTVIRYSNNSQDLMSRLEWASNEHKNQGFWVGYSIKVKMKEVPNYFNVTLDQFSEKRYSLFDSVISGTSSLKISQNEVWEMEAQKSHERKTGESEISGDEQPIDREVGVMIHFYGKTADFSEIDEVFASRMNKWVKIDNSPIYWLGQIEQTQSAQLLIDKYRENESKLLKVNFMELIGVHKNTETVLSFLNSVLLENENNKTKRTAIFWIGQQDNQKALELLISYLGNNKLKSLKANIISGISQMNIAPAESLIFRLAAESEDPEVKKSTIYWLGLKSTAKSYDVLKNLAFRDPNVELQKNAVLAISDMKNSMSIQLLVEIARTHANSEIKSLSISRLAMKAELFLERKIAESSLNKDETEIKKQALIALTQMCGEDNIEELVKIAVDHPNPGLRREAIRLLGKKDDVRALDAIIAVAGNLDK